MMSFQPSINISYDIGKTQLFENYVPNINQLNIMNAILTNVGKDEQHAHLIVGPYGAGKSLVGAMVTTLVVQSRSNKKLYNQFFESVYKVSPELDFSMRSALVENKFKWIPVTITGKSGSFETVILNSIQKKLQELDIPFAMKNDSFYINELIELWEVKHPEVLRNLEKILNRHDIELDKFVKQIKDNDEQAMLMFKNIYTEVAFGMPYHNPNTIEFIEQLIYLIDELAKNKIGIFIVFDEFGRFLQTISNAKIYETMQQIQDFAELVNRQKNAFALMITHTGLQQYANENTMLTKNELERVEKRFFEHRLESDSAIFYRSAHKVLNKASQSDIFLAKDFEDLKYNIIKYSMFQGMTTEEIIGFILEGCQPIHPLAIQILPSMSNLLGQNDRTLYLFLNQFKKKDYEGSWYYADQLFDYFYPDESLIFTLDSMKYYRLAINYKLSENALRLVKLGTLLNLINNRFTLSKDFIQFALGIAEIEADNIMQELLSVKLLRFNPFVNAYELYEGSLVIFEELYQNVEGKVIINNELRVEAIQEIYGEKYYLPLGYNTAKSMTRYIETQFAFATQDIKVDTSADGTLLYIFTKNEQEREQVRQIVSQYNSVDILFGIVDFQMEELLEHVNQYVLLNKMLFMPEILKEDANLKKEILIRLDAVSYRIQKQLQPLKEFNQDYITFYMKNEVVKISNINKFDIYLDEWMFKRYPLTPEVRNESFNKRNVMKIQRKSAIELLNQIMDPTFEGDFEVSGYGPDYLIYATTFKNLKFNFENLDEQSNVELKELRSRLVEFLNTNSRSTIYQLFAIALDEPFGIRDPLVPLFVVALLKDKWNQMAFYSNDFSITSITGEMLYEIIEQQAEFYEYEIYVLADEEQQVLKTTNAIFFEDENMIHPNRLFIKLTKWLLGLPRFTQISNKQDDDIIKFKEIIRASETDPLAASKKLFEMQLSLANLELMKNTLESFCERFKVQIYRETLSLFDVDEVVQIRGQHNEAIRNSPQLNEIITLFEKTEDIKEVILKVVGIRLEDWSDVTYNSYFTTLNQYLTVSNTEVIRLIDGNQVITTIQEVELSVKGNTIYNQLQRIVSAGGRTMNGEEVKYILYKLLQEI
ncbi:hypothetical protein M5J14_11510 [Lysinibacillus sp. OL1_EC]|uniref:hypothetical protein n=1 Tax=unclassified Lysinibacillus TaxID=2636778 RepID=UPI00103FAE0B|nr:MULTISPECIES: hypothetical protein [unclassified Lysinibacillus]MCM0625140.1 hypothetical protein [Lysinibacillus sp. OL1_EC]TBV87395.1 hypothetical protein EW028_13020 [Lysinibacillus sp. OL1]